MPYFLVLLHTSGGEKPDHVPFVDELIRRNVAFFGGHLELGDVDAAYVVRCDDAADAEAIVAEDPWVVSGVARAECLPWEIVAINTAAVEPSLVFTPDDV